MNEVVPNLNENINKNVNKDNLFQSEELQKENWAKSKEIISKNIKQIVWKAWIEPLYYEKIGRAHVRTPVTEKSRMPSSA